jgi:catechol 2,3-dioxygenase-like lactoylglutathione lyase family enzyme
MESEFLHVGITVKNIDRTVEFYKKYFGYELDFGFTFPPEFFEAKKVLYGLKPGSYAKAAFLRSPDNVVLELFEFNEPLPFQQPDWNRPAYHHICLKVENVPEKYQEMKADGVEFFFEPDFRGDPAQQEYWVFLKDPDGNMIELQ